MAERERDRFGFSPSFRNTFFRVGFRLRVAFRGDVPQFFDWWILRRSLVIVFQMGAEYLSVPRSLFRVHAIVLSYIF